MPPRFEFYPLTRPPVDFHHDAQRGHPTLQAPSADVVLHVCDEPIKAAGDWYVRCRGCGWTSSPQTHYTAAAALHCGVEEAWLEGQRCAYVLRRKLTEDDEFERLYPKLSKQVGRR